MESHFLLLYCSLVDIFSDEFGSISLERSMQGSGMSRRGQVCFLFLLPETIKAAAPV